ncbi:MAG: transposase [Burkholderiaceae bacterium]|nr:transposase [Burkholderiaceae bacterium]
MKKAGPGRKYTVEFRTAAVSQVIDGKRSIADVAAALDVPKGTLGNWVARAHAGLAPTMQTPSRPVTDLEAELSRLRAENSRLKLEKEILKKAAAYFAREST